MCSDGTHWTDSMWGKCLHLQRKETLMTSNSFRKRNLGEEAPLLRRLHREDIIEEALSRRSRLAELCLTLEKRNNGINNLVLVFVIAGTRSWADIRGIFSYIKKYFRNISAICQCITLTVANWTVWNLSGKFAAFSYSKSQDIGFGTDSPVKSVRFLHWKWPFNDQNLPKYLTLKIFKFFIAEFFHLHCVPLGFPGCWLCHQVMSSWLALFSRFK